MRNSSLREKFQKIPIYRILLGSFFALLVYDIIKGAICIGWLSKNEILAIVISLFSGIIVPYFKSDKSKTIERGNCWIFIAIIIEVVIAVNLTNRPNKIEPEKPIIVKEQCRENSLRQDSIQRCFDTLVNKFDNRMKQKLTFEDAYELIRGDSCVLYEILGMINDNPEIETKPRIDYIDSFRKRATEAKKIIRKAIVEYPGDGEKMCEEYGPKINQLEQMLNSL